MNGIVPRLGLFLKVCEELKWWVYCDFVYYSDRVLVPFFFPFVNFAPPVPPVCAYNFNSIENLFSLCFVIEIVIKLKTKYTCTGTTMNP